MNHSEDDQALTKIQHGWAEARMNGDIVFAEFKIDDLQVRVYGDTGIVVGQGTISAHEEKQNLLGGKFASTDTFVKQHGTWKVAASQVSPVLKK